MLSICCIPLRNSKHRERPMRLFENKIRREKGEANRLAIFFHRDGIRAASGPMRGYFRRPKKDYNFTDGCGLVSPSLVQQAARAAQIVFRNQKYLPSVIQIRYRGYKGVLTMEPNLKGKILVQFRDSMRKFKDVKDLKLAVVDYSKVSSSQQIWKNADVSTSHIPLVTSMTRLSYFFMHSALVATFCWQNSMNTLHS